MLTLAAIDVGSNAIRMAVSRCDNRGGFEVLENLRLPVRLGQDAFSSGQLSAHIIQLAVDAFQRFRQVADLFGVDQIRAVGTSALRDAGNSDILIDRVALDSGIAVEIISGEEEARLIHQAVMHAVNLQGKTSLLIDIGGGSVEVTLSADNNILSAQSFRMGTVRLLKKLEGQSGQLEVLNQLLQEYAALAVRYVAQEIGDRQIDIVLGTGGNIDEMGRLRRRLLNKRRQEIISLDDLAQLIQVIGEMTVEERVAKLGLNPDRADVILPAMIVLRLILQQSTKTELQIPGVGLKEGLLVEMAQASTGPSIPRRVQVMASVESMGRKYQFDAAHAEATARLAARIFNQTLSLHHLTENECLLLEAAAKLHDIGHFINTIDHDRHGSYLIQNHRLIGLTVAEQEILANLVQYHRKQTPSAADENLKNMQQKDRVVVTKLVALLRLADAAEISHQSRVQDINLEPAEPGVWRLYVQSEQDAMLEKWSLEKRKPLFQDVFGVKLEVI